MTCCDDCVIVKWLESHFTAVFDVGGSYTVPVSSN